MKKLDIANRSGVELDGVLFSTSVSNTVVIAITGIHGNFYSNPFYYNIGETLSSAGIDFIYAQTRDAFSKVEIFNKQSKCVEQIGSFNEDFSKAEEDVLAYIDFAQQAGYEHIILAGHSLGANKIINYLSIHQDRRVEKFIIISPANIKHLTGIVNANERQIINDYVLTGRGKTELPFPLLGWLPCVAETAYQWLYSDTLDNVHVEKHGDFSQIERITHTGALIIGTHDRFTYGDPTGFISNINDHMSTADENKLIFIQQTGHTFQQKEQELAETILQLVQQWDVNIFNEKNHAIHYSQS